MSPLPNHEKWDGLNILYSTGPFHDDSGGDPFVASRAGPLPRIIDPPRAAGIGKFEFFPGCRGEKELLRTCL